MVSQFKLQISIEKEEMFQCTPNLKYKGVQKGVIKGVIKRETKYDDTWDVIKARAVVHIGVQNPVFYTKYMINMYTTSYYWIKRLIIIIFFIIYLGSS